MASSLRRVKTLPTFLLLLAAALPSPAAEPWVDAKLPTEKGLELWFDATRQTAARAARKLPPLKDHSLVDALLDGSGQQRDLTQRVAEAQPRFRVSGTNAFVRFDGKDDFLAAANLRAVATLQRTFCVPAGFSDHTTDTRTGGWAAAAGLQLLRQVADGGLQGRLATEGCAAPGLGG